MTHSPSPERLFSLCIDLASIPSVTGLPGRENEAAYSIYRWLGDLPYFHERPENIFLIPVQNDGLKRHCIAALVEADPPCRETIIITGHFDVVDAKGYGSLESLAFQPQNYTERLKKEALPKDARADLESGQYLFGRGMADMKYGLALEMACMEKFSESPEKMQANLLFLAVCDEEGMSAGMRSAVSWLRELQKKKNLEYLVCINTEPSVGESAERGSLYLGTIGKIMPLFFCVGREAHVGEYFKGISAPLIASCLTTLVEGDAESADSWKDRVFPPMACLKLADLREQYAVTLPEMAVVFFNSLVVQKTPGQVLEYMNKRAEEALSRALALREGERQKLSFSFDQEEKEQGVVLTIQELIQDVAGQKGCLPQDVLGPILSGIHSGKTIHDRGIEAVRLLLRESNRRGPLIITGFLPPWYPPRCNRDASRGDRVIRMVAQEIVEESADLTEEPLEIKEVFEGIMDLSYMGFQGEEHDMEAVAANMPLWGADYHFPAEDLLSLDVPVMNLGPIGKDVHQYTERINLSYALHVLPPLFVKAIERIPKVYRSLLY